MGERYTGFGQVGKTPQLERGTIEFAIQAHRAQRGFRVGDGDQFAPIENAIRPIAIGKKNWLFTG
ncbi:hypothetical protein [Duganella sp. FT27W]|uniref:hypothetical protein n=1 Tax=Duganella sp. FT27W TaxID=2654636 RepID=UPI0035A67DF0